MTGVDEALVAPDDGAGYEAAVAEALKLVQFARFDEARARLQALDGVEPGDARIAFAHGLIAQRTGAIGDAIGHFKTAMVLNPGLHQAAEQAGALLRAAISPVCPPLAGPIADNRTFIYVIGSSYTRSFGVGSRFLPLMVGVADNLTFLTPELAARTTAHMLAHLERCDARNPVLLALANSDAIGLDMDTVGVRALQADGALGSDEEIIGQAAERHGDFLAEARRRFPACKLMVLAALPVLRPSQAPLVRLTNSILRRRADELGIAFLDVHDRLVDAPTGLIRAELCSAEGDAHLGKHAIPIIEEAIVEAGFLTDSDRDFEWSHMMRFRFTDLDETRLWTEPHMGAENLKQSRLNHFNYVLERAVSHLLAHLVLDGSESVLVVNAREGYVPLALPKSLCRRLSATEADASRRAMLRRLAHFTGRSDIEVLAVEADRRLYDKLPAHDHVFAVVHEDDDPMDVLERLRIWSHLVTSRLYVLSDRQWRDDDLVGLPFDDAQLIDLSESFLEGYWSRATLLVLAR
ncbi:MAG: hypothetical protein QF893_03595 [Alphaproteobacteria bacterium]|nr:hypothetical protein [Alphaproteobacteria bacterium]